MVRETRHLWVGNLPHAIREERVLEHFKRYGKVQSVKILPRKEEEGGGGGGACATVAFIDIKSAAKAHGADNKIDERTLKTDYYEPPASSTASSAIYIHERDPPAAPINRTPRYGLPEDRNYDRPGHYYGEREPYMRRPLGMGYHDEDNYQGRAKSRDRYSRSASGNSYTEGTERNQTHFRAHNNRQHFDQQRYSVGDQYNDDRETAATTPRLNRRATTTPATPSVASVASPTTAGRTEGSRPKRTKRRSPSRSLSGSRSNSGSRSRSSSGSRSSSSSSKLRSSSSDSSGRSRSPSKSRSPAASYASQSNSKGSRLDRPSSAITNPSSTGCYLPSTVNASAINCTTNSTNASTQGSSILTASDGNVDKEEKRPLGICVRNLPVRSTDTSLKDGLFHEYKKHGKVTVVKVIGQGTERYALVCFKKPEDVEKALEVSKDKLFFGCKIEVTAHEGLDAEDNEFRPLEAELDEFHPKATRTLFIGNLEKDITTAELRKHFDQFGEIIEIDIKKQGSATSYAFIQYSDIASVVKAMRKLDGENLGANRIKLGFGKSMPTNCVWLDGIAETVAEKFLARHFSRFGIVTYTVVDREKGHALIFYESVEFAQIAVSDMRGRILGGKKLQVDFASRECQSAFFDKLEMTGQIPIGDGTRPWERRDRRAPDFEVIRSDDRYGREPRVGFDNRVYPRYEGQPRPARGTFRGVQRPAFPARGRGQGYSPRYDAYHDEFGERRHRYNSRDETSESSSFDLKADRTKYGDGVDSSNRKRNKLRNSISDQESHHSQSPPRSRHESRSTSPASRKSVKDKLHGRIKSPSSRGSSIVSSPCRDDADVNSEYRDFRPNKADASAAVVDADNCDRDDRLQSKAECESVRSHSSESADEVTVLNEHLSQLERKKRLLASSVALKGGKDSKAPAKIKSPGAPKPSKANCVSEGTADDAKSDHESAAAQDECTKDKSHHSESANPDLKYLQKRHVQLLQRIGNVHEGDNSSDTENSVDSDRLARKKHRSSFPCINANSLTENDIAKSITKDECGTKLCKTGIKDSVLLSKMKKLDGVDGNNSITLSLDSIILHKHLDPRKGFSSLQKSRRISVDGDAGLPPAPGSGDSFLCAKTASDVPWKKQQQQHGSLSDIRFSDDGDERFKAKDDTFDDDVVNKKSFVHSSPSSMSLELPKCFLSRMISPGHESSKRDRDVSPLSLPLPKFAASLRSPKSSPGTLTSPKGTTAHSPRAGHSPSSYAAAVAAAKSIKIPDLFHDVTAAAAVVVDKKPKDVLQEKINGASISPLGAISPYESQAYERSMPPCMEPIQSPKTNIERIKETIISSSESDLSPASSPNRPSIEDRIKALDEKFTLWSSSSNTPSTNTVQAVVPPVAETQPKRSRYNSLSSEIRSEPSEIVKSLLAKSTIFDQDSKRLQHIDEKYEPLSVKMEASPQVKPAFRTKAAAKEFSTPITSPIQNFAPPLHAKTAPSMLAAQSIISPPATPQNATLSPLTSPLTQYSQLPPQLFTPRSPHSASFGIPTPTLKNIENTTIEKEDAIVKPHHVFNSVKIKTEPLVSSKMKPLSCPVEIPTHGLIINSPLIKKEPISSPPDSIIQTVCKSTVDTKVSIKKETPSPQVSHIPIKKECTVSLAKDQLHFNSLDHDKKDICDLKDPRLANLHEVDTSWRENGCKDNLKHNVDSSAKLNSVPTLEITDGVMPAIKKRVSSIDSTESDSSKSLKSLESSRDSHETSWSSKDKVSEPEAKKPKLSKSSSERSSSPPSHQSSKKIEKREKIAKSSEKSTSKSSSKSSTSKDHHESKSSSKSEHKSKTEHKSKDEKRSKSRDSKESSSQKGESKPKSKDKSQSSEKEARSGHSSSQKSKKDSPSTKTDKQKSEKKSGDRKSGSNSSKSKSSNSELQAFIEEEPVYFSMYDKVKARSSKTQTLKHQAKDLETMRQKFSKLKQSRAKREEKTKSIDQDTDKDSDSCSHHSSESDSQSKSTKVKQQRKRKLVIESSSDDEDGAPRDSNSRVSKVDKDFSDSATDSEFEYSVTHRSSNSYSKTKKKKSEIFGSDSSDSETSFPQLSQNSSKKKSQHKSKSRPEKPKKILKSEDDVSDAEVHRKIPSKEKDHKSKKVKKEKSHSSKAETDSMEVDVSKKHDDSKSSKKKPSKESKESDSTAIQKKLKTDSSKEKLLSSKDKKINSSIESMQTDDSEKHKTYAKKRKKSKKLPRNKEKRMSSEKTSHDSSHSVHDDHESDAKSSLPILLSPKPSSPAQDKQLSPPCLQAGILSDNDFKSDFSDFEFEPQSTDDAVLNIDIWKQLENKSDSNSDKGSKSKNAGANSKPLSDIHSSEHESSLPSFLDKLSDVTDSETGKEPMDVSIEDRKPSSKKEAEISPSTPHKNKHEKLAETDDSSKQESSNRHSDAFSSSSKEERRRKKAKKQNKEKRKKAKDESPTTKEITTESVPVPSSPKATLFDALPCDEDSRLSDLHLDEEIAEEARRLEQELLAASEENSTFGDDSSTKREEKQPERKFEEEAAKEAKRLEAELFSTGRESWQEKSYDAEPHTNELCSSKVEIELQSVADKSEDLFASLEMHTATTETTQNEAEVFLSGQSESDQYKLEDKDTNDIEDQRKIEDDLAVSALLQEMHCGEISAPELTKETDYLDPLMEAHPEDTVNYLIPDDSENSLHIADSSPPDTQASESEEAKLAAEMILSPASNSEPPSLEISTGEDAATDKISNDVVESETTKAVEDESLKIIDRPSFEHNRELIESRPPVIDIPSMSDAVDQGKEAADSKCPKRMQKKKDDKLISSIDNHANEDTDDESTSELGENQLTRFEDITMDTTDSKDDDNPPVLLPVESPRNMLLNPESKEEMKPLSIVENQNNTLQKPTISNETPFSKVVDMEKDIGSLVNNIINYKKQEEAQASQLKSKTNEHELLHNLFKKDSASDHDELKTCDEDNDNSFLQDIISDLSSPKGKNSELPNGNSKTDSIHSSLSRSPPTNKTNTFESMFDYLSSDEKDLPHSRTSEMNKHDSTNLIGTGLFDSSSSEELKSSLILKPQLKDSHIPMTTTHMDDSEEESENKYMLPTTDGSDIFGARPVNYEELLEASCGYNVHEGTFKHSIASEKPEPVKSVSEKCDANDDSDVLFLRELFGPCKEDKKKTDPIKSEIEKTKNDHKKKDDPPEEITVVDCHQDDNIKPLFDIPDVNEQNEATEFNHDIFEPNQPKDKLPELLSFSSKQLFAENTPDKHPVDGVLNVTSYAFTTTDNAGEKLQKKEQENTSGSDENRPPPSASNANVVEVEDQDDEHKLSIEESLDMKSGGSGDVESVCSDTTDITTPDAKLDNDINPASSNEDAVLETPEPVEIVPQVKVTTKPKVERPRRGRRPRTRKYSEMKQKGGISRRTHARPPPSRNPGKRTRPILSQRTRRNLRSGTSEPTQKEVLETKALIDELSDDIKSASEEKKAESVISDKSLFGTDGLLKSRALHIDLGAKPPAKRNDEPRKRRGRRKKASGDYPSRATTKTENEVTKDFNRPKDSRLWLSVSSEKEQKSKENPSAIDIYDYQEEEECREENVSFKSIRKRLHENTRSSLSTTTTTATTTTTTTTTIIEHKMPDTFLEKEKKVEEVKPKVLVEEKVTSPKEPNPEPVIHQKVFKKELIKKFEDVKKNAAANEERETSPKEHNAEINPRQKIRMTIRYQNDGTSPSTAEVVKISEALNVDDVKFEFTKTEKASAKHETTEVPYNGPCKSTRKSMRLMNQATRSTVDEVIEGVVKKNVKVNNTHMTRRSRSSRRSEEGTSVMLQDNSEDASDEKNKNEPVLIILDNAVKDASNGKKASNPGSPPSVDVTSEPEQRPTRGGSHKSYRVTRSTASKLESKESTEEPHKKENPSSLEESSDTPQKDTSKEIKTIHDITHRSPLPVLKIELPRVVLTNTKDVCKIEKATEHEDEKESKNVLLVDPYTGDLAPVNESGESLSDMSNVESKIPIKTAPHVLPGASVIQENIKAAPKSSNPGTKGNPRGKNPGSKSPNRRYKNSNTGPRGRGANSFNPENPATEIENPGTEKSNPGNEKWNPGFELPNLGQEKWNPAFERYNPTFEMGNPGHVVCNPGHEKSNPGHEKPNPGHEMPAQELKSNPGPEEKWNPAIEKSNPGHESHNPGHEAWNPGHEESNPGHHHHSRNPGHEDSNPGHEKPNPEKSNPGHENPSHEKSNPGHEKSGNPGHENPAIEKSSSGQEKSSPGPEKANPEVPNPVPETPQRERSPVVQSVKPTVATPTQPVTTASTIVTTTSTIEPPKETPPTTTTTTTHERMMPPNKKFVASTLAEALASTLASSNNTTASATPSSTSVITTSPIAASAAVVHEPMPSHPSSVVTRHPAPVSATLNLAIDKSEQPSVLSTSGAAEKTLPHVRAIATTVVTSVSSEHSTSRPSSVQEIITSRAVATPPTDRHKPEISEEYASVPRTSHIEQIANLTCNPSVLTAPSATEHSSLPLGKYDVHTTSLPHTSSITSTWSSPKISSRIMSSDAIAHISAIQPTSSSSSASSKSESRSSKSHGHGKNSSAYGQPAFPVSAYETPVLSSAHNLAAMSGNNGGVIAELLQNPQLLQQHKDYFAATAGQLGDRIPSHLVRPTTPIPPGIPPEIAARLGNPTPPHTPTPPVTTTLQPSDIHHLRHPAQPPPPLMVPPHAGLGLHHPTEVNAYLHQQMMYAAATHSFSPVHPDLRAQEAQARAVAAMGIGTRFPYPALHASNFRQPSEPKPDAKPMMHEARVVEEKSQHHHSSKRSKKEEKMHADDREHEGGRHMPHEKMPPTTTISPHALNVQQPHAHYSSTIRQLSPRLSISPHERISNSPAIANLYAPGQGRVPPIPIPGQPDDPHHYKGDPPSEHPLKPPIAHQSQPSTLPYHPLDPSSRHGVPPPIGTSAAAAHLDIRIPSSAHSLGYKKDSGHPQQPAEKRPTQEHPKKAMHNRALSQQASSISPGPVSQSPLPLIPVMPSHSSHQPVSHSSHSLTSSSSISRHSGFHLSSQMGTDVSALAPPPAHAISQQSNIPRTLPQTPPHASQVPYFSDAIAFLQAHYPIVWQGMLALKNDLAYVQMHYLSGNPAIARTSLPILSEGSTTPVRISQRMRFDQTQLDGVSKKMQVMDEHCMLMAIPCGKDSIEVLHQTTILRNGFINYLQCKQAAGIVNAQAPGSQQAAYVVHIFPSCEFSELKLQAVSPDLGSMMGEIAHLVIIIATV